MLNYRPGNATTANSDGLDIDSGDVWFSPDASDIYLNGVLFASTGNLAQRAPGQHYGCSGVERVGSAVYAVATSSGGFSGEDRTIVEFDLAPTLIAYDPDGDPTSVRWEDMAFDGQYLYAADVFGNADGAGIGQDVYVFDLGGGFTDPGGEVPEASTVLAGLGLAGLLGGSVIRRRCKR